MTRLVWSQVGQRFYETGLDRGVLYLQDGTVVPWDGLTSLDEDFGTSSSNPYFLDGVKYLDVAPITDYAATLKAFTYPDEFAACIGQEALTPGLYIDDQEPKPFNLVYRTRIGNDLDSELGYKIHICYNLLVVPDDTTFPTIADVVTPNEFSWKITSTPVELASYAPTSHLIVDSRYIYPRLLGDLENLLYGTDTDDPSLPDAGELTDYVYNWRLIKIIDNGDGTWTASGPDDLITMLDPTTFKIHAADATYLDANTYVITDSYVEEGG